MSKDSTDTPPRTVREAGAQYVVNGNGQQIAVLLPIQEYEHYLDLLDDEADSQDAELAARLAQASSQPVGGERHPFRDDLHQRGVDDASLQSLAPQYPQRHHPRVSGAAAERAATSMTGPSPDRA